MKFAVGSALGPLGGIVVFVGMEIGSLISAGSLVPGARLAEGILWMAGPANTLFAIACDGIAELGSRERALHRRRSTSSRTRSSSARSHRATRSG